MKRPFDMQRCAKNPNADAAVHPPDKKRPRLSDLVGTAEKYKERPSKLLLVGPPAGVLSKLSGSDMFMWIDLQVHDWIKEEGEKSRYGQFGHYMIATKENTQYKRIVKLAWIVGTGTDDLHIRKAKVMKIRPDDFEISAKAVGCHGITQQIALDHGIPLVHALTEMMEDAQSTCKHGGRLVSHHYGHKADIIMNELERAGLVDKMPSWKTCSRKACCTMDPDLGQWILECCRKAGPKVKNDSGKRTLNLDLLCDWLVSGHDEKKDHVQDLDRKLHLNCLLYHTLQKLAQAAIAEPNTLMSHTDLQCSHVDRMTSQ